jgi:hypothetical protein
LAPAASSLPIWAGGALFWTAMLLLLGYAAYIYFSGKGVNFGWLTALWRMLVQRWRLFRGALSSWVETRLPTAQRSSDDTSDGRRIPLSRWKLSKLDDEQRVRYFYLTTVERAEHSGLPRHSGETPRQFAPRLTERLGKESGEESGEVSGEASSNESAKASETFEAVQTLTEAFVRVRYSKGHFKSTEVSTLQRIWEQIRQHLHL